MIATSFTSYKSDVQGVKAASGALPNLQKGNLKNLLSNYVLDDDTCLWDPNEDELAAETTLNEK